MMEARLEEIGKVEVFCRADKARNARTSEWTRSGVEVFDKELKCVAVELYDGELYIGEERY